MTAIVKAMVENPYYLRDCDLSRSGDYHAAAYFNRHNQEEYLELDVILDDGIYYPYFNREYMTDIWRGMRIKQIGVE